MKLSKFNTFEIIENYRYEIIEIIENYRYEIIENYRYEIIEIQNYHLLLQVGDVYIFSHSQHGKQIQYIFEK